MKKAILIGLTLLSTIVQADPNRPPRQPTPFPAPGRDSEQLRACLQDLNRAKSDLMICENTRMDTRELDRLRRENDDLKNENRYLRDQLDRANRDRDPRDPRDPRFPQPSLGFFSYAGCKNYQGIVDAKFISSGEGLFQLEAETNAKQSVAQAFNCNYGIALAKSEEIKTTAQINYCVAGCVDYQGNVDQKYIQSGRGRNIVEAEFNALKSVAKSFTCNYGIKIQTCQ